MAKIYRTKRRPRRQQYGRLVWEVNGQETVLLDDLEWHVLSARRKQLLNNPYYRRGKLKLKY